MKTSSELNKIKSLVSEDVWDIFRECNVIIAGGAITSTFSNKDVNDVDVYVRNKYDFAKFIMAVYASNHALIPANMTNRSILFRDKATQQDVQLIVYKYFPTVDDIFNDYDFTINMGALECNDDKFTFHDDFFKHNAQRYLQFHTGTAYPLISALRVQKYIDRGYTISKSQMLRLLLTISQLSIATWDQLKDEIGGMYGLNMDDVFPENEEFSLDKAISVLDEIVSDSKFKTVFSTIEKSEIFDKFFPEYNYDGIYAKDKFFKNVAVMPDGRIVSKYNTNFEYKVGGMVDGGERGIYCYRGSEVLSGMYNDYSGGHIILELEQENPDNEAQYSSSDSKYQLFGNVKVIAKYTNIEFMDKFIPREDEEDTEQLQLTKKSDPTDDDDFFPFG
jgi:hypothetical protein